MSGQPAPERARYTYEDYLNFPDDIRCEIINGEIYDMTPAPTPRHQLVSGEICVLIRNHLKAQGSPCLVFSAPTDVVLAQDQVVQPDVFIVCDRAKIVQYISGAPDVIFEILSPSTTLKDRREKMELFERFGVLEYFLVDPEAQLIEKHTLIDAKYSARPGIYAGDDKFRIDTIALDLTAKDLFIF